MPLSTGPGFSKLPFGTVYTIGAADAIVENSKMVALRYKLFINPPHAGLTTVSTYLNVKIRQAT